MTPVASLLVLGLLAATAACTGGDHRASAAAGAPNSRRGPARGGAGQLPPIGVITLDAAGRPCLALDGHDLAPGAELAVFDVPDSLPPRTARVEGPHPAGCGASGGPAATERHYLLSVVHGALEPGRVYFGIAVPPAHFRAGREGPEVDLDGDGTSERFRICTSLEGLHLTVWSGAPPTARRRWHRYYHLGYDVEPSCEDPDGKPADSTAASRALQRPERPASGLAPGVGVPHVAGRHAPGEPALRS